MLDAGGLLNLCRMVGRHAIMARRELAVGPVAARNWLLAKCLANDPPGRLAREALECSSWNGERLLSNLWDPCR